MTFQYGQRCDLRPPADLRARITRAGGVNFYGEPAFRIAFSQTRLGWVGGKFEAEEFAGNLGVGVLRVPIYSYLGDVWVIEKWVSADHYGSPRAWKTRTQEWIDGVQVDTLGPYPLRGEYEHVVNFPASVSLTPTICDRVVEMVRKTAEKSGQDRMDAANQRIESKERNKRSLYGDIIDDVIPAFSGMPHAVVPGGK